MEQGGILKVFKAASMALLALALVMPASGSVFAPGTGLAGAVPGVGDAAPFGFGNLGLYLTGWQEIYDSSLFGGSPITIAGLRFFHTQFTDSGFSNTINDTHYTITLITTTLGIDQLDPTSLPANATSSTVSSETFFSGTLSGHVGKSFTISPADPSQYYNYDPSQGNLLIYVTKAGSPDGLSLFLDFASDPTVPMSTGFEFSDLPDANNPSATLTTNVVVNYGLVTQFLTPADLTTPEPGTFVPLGLGLASILYLGLLRGKLAR